MLVSRGAYCGSRGAYCESRGAAALICSCEHHAPCNQTKPIQTDATMLRPSWGQDFSPCSTLAVLCTRFEIEPPLNKTFWHVLQRPLTLIACCKTLVMYGLGTLEPPCRPPFLSKTPMAVCFLLSSVFDLRIVVSTLQLAAQKTDQKLLASLMAFVERQPLA